MSPSTDRPRPSRPPAFASFWIDESYTKTATGACIVMAGIKTRAADDLQREIKSVREHHQYEHELKFTKMSARTYEVLKDIVDVLEGSDAHIIASVSDLRANNPFQGRHEWRAHAKMAAQLIVGNINQGEHGVAYLDSLTTPKGMSMGTSVKRQVNTKVGSHVLVDAISLNSKANDLLQVADAIAGAILYERDGTTSNLHKSKFVRRLAAAFELKDLQDVRLPRVNILTLHDRRPLKLVPTKSRVS